MRGIPRTVLAAAVVFTGLSAGLPRAEADDAALSRELRATFVANLEASQKKDLQGVIATIHSKSPVMAPTVQLMQKLFESYEIEFTPLDFKYIATDEGYAICRTKSKALKISGPQFRDNTVTALMVFKKDGKNWKIWTQTNLEIQYNDRQAPATFPPKK